MSSVAKTVHGFSRMAAMALLALSCVALLPGAAVAGNVEYTITVNVKNTLNQKVHLIIDTDLSSPNGLPAKDVVLNPGESRRYVLKTTDKRTAFIANRVDSSRKFTVSKWPLDKALLDARKWTYDVTITPADNAGVFLTVKLGK